MKALSLWQPHAQAIALWLKPWETRDWSTRYRGPLAIHASRRRWDDSGPWHQIAARVLRERGDFMSQSLLPYGAVVCVVDLVDCVPTRELRGVIPSEHQFWGDFSDGDQGLGRFAFRLKNVRPITPPFPVRGQQGFFEIELPGFEGVTASAGNLSLFGEG